MPVKIFKSKKEIAKYLEVPEGIGKTIGFVPTMGALHEGHIALIKKSKAENEFTVASIFINPTQFNDKKDLLNYPRNPQKDIEMLEVAGCDILFMPDETEMYDNNEALLQIDLNNLDNVMEGTHRPGHFAGVVTVVDKLFRIVKPDAAYFGEKDFQQLAIIRLMTNRLHPEIKITGVPTVRENDGLAMSSRNERLSAEERKNASVIYQSMMEAKTARNNFSVAEIKKQVLSNIESFPLFKVEYFEIGDAVTLKPVSNWEESNNLRAYVAVRTSTVRLIDNIEF